VLEAGKYDVLHVVLHRQYPLLLLGIGLRQLLSLQECIHLLKILMTWKLNWDKEVGETSSNTAEALLLITVVDTAEVYN